MNTISFTKLTWLILHYKATYIWNFLFLSISTLFNIQHFSISFLVFFYVFGGGVVRKINDGHWVCLSFWTEDSSDDIAEDLVFRQICVGVKMILPSTIDNLVTFIRIEQLSFVGVTLSREGRLTRVPFQWAKITKLQVKTAKLWPRFQAGLLMVIHCASVMQRRLLILSGYLL